MDISVSGNGLLRLKEVYEPIILETEKLVKFSIAIKGDGIEVLVINRDGKNCGSYIINTEGSTTSYRK
ncbi:hypothetical protein DRO91_06095 [Candidatus Heimdallarchaeota archaeon]|nr:MAG: hypothetical protein DRO91_06095 [Candidatus Heimdallarchaeota archaeon]